MFIFTLNFNSSFTCICTLGFNYPDLKHFNKHYLHRFSEGKLAGRVGGWVCWLVLLGFSLPLCVLFFDSILFAEIYIFS